MPMATNAAGVHLLFIMHLLPILAVGVQKSASAHTVLTGGRTPLEEELNEAAASDGVAVGRTQRKVSLLSSEMSSALSSEMSVEGATVLGTMNKVGVTRYQDHIFKKAKGKDGKLFWPDPANQDVSQRYSGATDLSNSLTWGWHHPTGVYNTIPVGSPLFDDEQNIYLGADDAIRKFDVNGTIKWSYAPRGQLAAAPTLLCGSTRRLAEVEKDAEEERLLRPDWAKGDEHQFSVKVGDLVKVKPGSSLQKDGLELYRAGDKGLISSVLPAEEGKASSAIIQWTRTGHETEVRLQDVKDHFERLESKGKALATSLPCMVVGSTTSGYVFAIAMDSGEELWATLASNEISGVKGSVAGKDGIIVVATDRCTDRYCYRYRNQTQAFTPGNLYVRGLNAADGSAVWAFKPMAPVWNMVPLWGPDGSVLFQDGEGRAYSLDLQTGEKRFQVGGDLGSYTNAAAVYDPGHNIMVAVGVRSFHVNNYDMASALGVPTGKYCNPYPAPGILVNCFVWGGAAGFVRGYNASSGRKLWETNTPEPPANAAVGNLNNGQGTLMGTRLIVTIGMNCRFNSPSQVWALDPNNGHIRWMKDGPTLWTAHCAGDKEGADIRRAMGGRARCNPNSWSAPAADSNGDFFVGSQVGSLLKFTGGGGGHSVELTSTLTTGVAFQDTAIAFAPGVMAVSTCTSLIVFSTPFAGFENATWSVSHNDYSPNDQMVHGEEVSHTISEEAHDAFDTAKPQRTAAVPWLY